MPVAGKKIAEETSQCRALLEGRLLGLTDWLPMVNQSQQALQEESSHVFLKHCTGYCVTEQKCGKLLPHQMFLCSIGDY